MTTSSQREPRLRSWWEQSLPYLRSSSEDLARLVWTEIENNPFLEEVPKTSAPAEGAPADVIVTQETEGFVVRLNEDRVPRLRVREPLASAGSLTDSDASLRQAAEFICRAISRRQHAVYLVACEIVRVQHGFFQRGVLALVQLTLDEIAKGIGFSESTVSRAMLNKTMQTPFGIVALHFFTSPGYRIDTGQMIAATSVKQIIAKLIAAEDSIGCLSDGGIAATLKKLGLPVARRTVTKYRIQLKLPASYLRKKPIPSENAQDDAAVKLTQTEARG